MKGVSEKKKGSKKDPKHLFTCTSSNKEHFIINFFFISKSSIEGTWQLKDKVQVQRNFKMVKCQM